MYHEGRNCLEASYYDTIEEMPKTAKVEFPDGSVKEMTESEMYGLSNEGWYTIMHSCNYGCCDHWTSEKLEKWVRERFNGIIRYVGKYKETIGYNRRSWYVKLTKQKNYFKSEVWNS